MPRHVPVFGGMYILGSHNFMSPQLYARMAMRESTSPEERRPILDILKSSGGNQLPTMDTDPREADAYALGLVLCKLLTGKNPTIRYDISAPAKGYEWSS